MHHSYVVVATLAASVALLGCTTSSSGSSGTMSSTSAAAPPASAAPARPIRVYGMAISGHSHRVRLFLTLLGLPFETIEIDVLKGESQRPEFLARNAFGQVPVIEDGELTLADSNAILVYLARRYDTSGRWLPDDAVGAARVQRWLSVAAGELADGPASARFACLIGRTPTPRCDW